MIHDSGFMKHGHGFTPAPKNCGGEPRDGLPENPKPVSECHGRKSVVRGFTLIEALVSVGILVTAFGGMLALARGVIGSSSVVRQDLIAAALAQEGVEVIRAMRDANWLSGNTADNSGFPPNPGTWRRGLENGTGNNAYGVDWKTPNKPQPGLAGQEKTNRTKLLYLQNDGTYTYDGTGTPTPFRREVELSAGTNDPDSEMHVRVTVRWCRSATTTCANESTLTVEDRLWNWFPR